MKYIIIVTFLLFIFAVTHIVTGKKMKNEKEYHYLPKGSLMTESETGFMQVLMEAVGQSYYVCPQIQLSAVVDHAVKGQSYRAALSRVQRKSVDYVVCDKLRFIPVFAVELDDPTHDAQDRQDRDNLVEAILKEVRLPLLRFRDWRKMPKEEIINYIRAELTSKPTA